MALLRKKRKPAALNKKKSGEHLRRNLAQNSNVPRSQEYHITKVSEETEIRVTKKLSKEFNRWGSPILDEFLQNLLIQGHSGTAPEASRNTLGTNQGTNEDDSQSDPHPEMSVYESQTTRNSGPDDAYDNNQVKSI